MSVVGWARQHPRGVDGAVAAVVFLINLPVLAAYVPGRLPAYPVALLVSAGLCLPAVFRRDRPVVSFAAIALVSFAQWTLGVIPTYANALLFAGLATIAARHDRRISLAAAGVVELGAVLVVLRWGDHLGEVLFQLVAATAFVASVWMWGRNAGTRRAYLESLRERAAQLERERRSEALLAAAEERARIAREVHDIVSHSLSAMVVQATGAAHNLPGCPEVAARGLTAIRDTGREALTEMRQLLAVLREGESDPVPQPGAARLEHLVQETRQLGLPVDLTVEGVPRELPSGVDLTLYRIVQEALTNVRRHAGPNVTEVLVHLSYQEGMVEVRVRDDGTGPAGASDGSGYGLVGMRERIALYEGALHTGPRAGGGYEVQVVLPTQPVRG